MTSFFNALYMIVKMALAGGVKRLLLGAGLGLFSGTIFLTVINYFISKLIANLGALGQYAGLFGIIGLDKAISIVIGAYVVRLTILSTLKVTLGKSS